MKFDITQVIGISNDDPVSTEFRPFKEMVKRLSRTFKASYRNTCGYEFLVNSQSKFHQPQKVDFTPGNL